MDEAKVVKSAYYPINERITLRHHTLGEIIDFGEKNYAQLANLFCITPYDLMVELWDMGVEDYETLSNYDVFIMLCHNESYRKLMNFLIVEDYNFQLGISSANTEAVLYDPTKGVAFDRLCYELVAGYMKKINFITHDEQKKVQNGTRGLKAILVENMRAEREAAKAKPEAPSKLNALISSLVWGNTSGITYNNVYDLKIYQFYDGLNRISKIKNNANIMTGIYTGSIDPKNIDKSSLNWMD